MADKEKKQFIDEEGGKTLLLGVLELLEQLQGSITAIGDNSVYLIPVSEVYYSHALGIDEEGRDASIEIKDYAESMPDASSTDDNARVILVPTEEEAAWLFKDLGIWNGDNAPNGVESWVGAYLLVDVTEGDPEDDDWKLTPTIVKHWKDERNFKPGDDYDHQYYNARFYKTSGGDLWLGGTTDMIMFDGKLGMGARLLQIENNISRLQQTVNDIPTLTEAQKKDGKAYALVNGVYDDICGADYTLLAEKDATAQSLALKSLESGVLVLDGADEQMIEEMREILGEERFNEMAAASVQTMELKPQLSIEEQIEAAKAAYDRRKAEALEEAEIVESSDVEPINKEKK